MDWHQIFYEIVAPSLATALTALFSACLYKLLDVFQRWAASQKHGAAAGICVDAVKAAWTQTIKPSIIAKMADGKMTDEEWEQLKDEVKACAKQMANERLAQLRGFAPKAAGAWLEGQLDAALGELLGGMFGGSAETIQADTPASEDGK